MMLPFCIIGILFSYSALADSSSYSPQIAIGSYQLEQNLDLLPPQAVLLHHNEDNSWSNSTIPWVTPPEESRINDASCIENNCIAAPYSSYGYGTSMPFFLMSHDGGKTWYTNRNITGLPDQIKSGEPKSIYCEGTLCLSSGWYETAADYGTARMLLTSSNSGQSWSFSPLPQPPYGGYSSYLSPVRCLGNNCMIGVAYFSDDKGLTWSPSQITGVPSNSDIEISDIQCSSTVCIADGRYDSHLLLLISKNKGHSWKFIYKVPTPNIKFVTPRELIYSNGSFILVGGYSVDPASFGYQGFILISKDEGASWSWIEKVSGIDHTLTAFSSISCSDDICVSGGNNKKGLNFIISHDHGMSWQTVKNITGMNETPNIDTIQCKENRCTVFGSFLNTVYENHIHPIVIDSLDQGETWTINKNILNFPEHLAELKFSEIE